MELDELRRISAKEELSLNFVAKDEMISRVLVGLQGFDNLILKGGTAINRVYIKNRRFSEDIDFDLVFSGTVNEALPATRQIIAKLAGFSIERPRIMKGTIRYDLFYTNPLNHKDRIRVEFKIAKKASGAYSKKAVGFGFVPFEPALLNVYELEEILTQKIGCIMGRMEGKDFLDVFYLIELPHKHIELAKLRKEEIIKRITLEENQIRAVANVINHYLPRTQRPQWGLFLEEMKKKIMDY
ncbi:MAG: nucleotidyl transferase AbiEii/AbiGii toxin family protein [Nanoarchaeota archaeon]|nr:nucleotidyl transferase AbiEii/AbiGii toxin family protein [Nanoarchaeota archaeon]